MKNFFKKVFSVFLVITSFRSVNLLSYAMTSSSDSNTNGENQRSSSTNRLSTRNSENNNNSHSSLYFGMFLREPEVIAREILRPQTPTPWEQNQNSTH